MSDERAYVALCPHCGCWRACAMPPVNPSTLADWSRRGLDIQRMTVAEVRSMPWKHKPDCPEYRPPQKRLTFEETT